MMRTMKIIGLLAGLFLLAGASPALPLPAPLAAASKCTPVQTSQGNLTAAVVAISGQVIKPTGGNNNLNAAGCDVGIYVGPSVTGVKVSAFVHDANQYGVLNEGGADVGESKITDIGNHSGTTFAPNGVQTGIGVYYAAGASGSITNNQISDYQKGGIVADGSGTNVTISGNTVTGLGPIKFIAQNGIQVSHGATASVTGNTVSGNIYTQNGSAAPAGVGSSVGVVSTGILRLSQSW